MALSFFDCSRVLLEPLEQRIHDMSVMDVKELDAAMDSYTHPDFHRIVGAIRKARKNDAAVIFMMGAHVIKTGLSRFVIKMMEDGWISHVALNGAGCIHDYELALIGATTESVAKYISEGKFGLWKDTGRINDIAKQAQSQGTGLGETVGKTIMEESFPYRDISILAAGHRLGIPVTVHVGIGQDIIHAHPNCDGASLGAASYHDFLILAHSISNLENGVFLNFGTAVMGPEVYLKALSMVRNVAYQDGKEVRSFTTAVFDLVPLGEDAVINVPTKDNYLYYFRPWKTILVRTVADGGQSFYFCGDHRQTIPSLARELENSRKTDSVGEKQS